MKRLCLLFISFYLLSCSTNEQKKKIKEVNTFHDQAYVYRDTRKTDSAFLYFIKAKDLFLQRGDSLGVANCLVNLAIISTDVGDYFGGQELSLNALPYLNKEKKEYNWYLHSNYNNLGMATERLRDYQKAITFYDLAIAFSADSSGRQIYQNNKATAYQGLKQYKNALAIYNQLLKKNSKDKIAYARVLTNIAVTKWRLNQNYNVLPELLAASQICEREQDFWGLNYSYAYLSDYYAKSNLDSASFYANQMFQTAKKLDSPDDQLFALQKLVKFSPSKSRNAYFEKYLALDDSIQTVRNLAKNRFALIKFETEKHKADKLVLQKENTEKKFQLIILIITTLALLIGGIFWYRKRRERLKLEAQNLVRENQLKTSKKVHDVVANGLYRVITEIENQSEIDKEGILDKIEDMYEKSRDISYEQPETRSTPFHQTIDLLLKSFSSENLSLGITGNKANLWKDVSVKAKDEMVHILQELMVNMKKHSAATTVSIQFKQKAQHISVEYIDNGVGFTENKLFGNGLTNTETRIKNISGTITFETIENKGLKILISFPIQN